jgi:hypothetical protein
VQEAVEVAGKPATKPGGRHWGTGSATVRNRRSATRM